ncbi:hypothetical protein CBF34_06970 [Vagococcus penaei]|uniref:Uncharacterized protein n=2 Tax=Vagococcus penaei TaxID=633807 RepID=A0A1Q2D3G6_9ENTE|nr:hypothetical protein BW732_00805 [Vagococcus penaei]RSU01395.1 hypothetical protein CBF34_06970 [Vagococcus penaei]
MERQSRTRKHFRFPAYDDDEGVKLKTKKERDLFQDFLDDGFVHRTKFNLSSQESEIDPVEMTDEPDYFGSDRMESQKQVYSSPRTSRNIQAKTPFHEKHLTLPDKKIAQKNYTTGNKSNSLKSEQSNFSNRLVETDRLGKARYQNRGRSRQQFQSSYHLPGDDEGKIFKPKHIPASMIDDTYDTKLKSVENKQELMSELRKTADENQLRMAFDPDYLETATEPKNENKHQRLDKSLSGIMADENTSSAGHYFD